LKIFLIKLISEQIENKKILLPAEFEILFITKNKRRMILLGKESPPEAG